MNRMDDMFFMKKFGRNPPKRFTAYDTKIKKILNEENENISFVYDFGDDWTINLILKKLILKQIYLLQNFQMFWKEKVLELLKIVVEFVD